jgi:IclR family acetate operon transcriptional repressor
MSARSGSNRERPSGRQQIKVLGKAFEILEALHLGNREGVRLSKIGDVVGLPRPTVFRILRTLESMGYVTFDGALECYRIAQRLADLGQPSTQTKFTRLARPPMMRLLADFEQTVNLAVLDRNQIVMKDLIEGLRSVRMQVTPGIVISATRTALGKAILAYLEPTRVPALARVLRGGSWRTESRVNLNRLHTEFEEIRKVGYAVDDEETEKGLRCVGAPVFDGSGEPCGAISVSGSVNTIHQEVIFKIGKRLRKECDEISFALGYSPGKPVGLNRNGNVMRAPKRSLAGVEDESLSSPANSTRLLGRSSTSSRRVDGVGIP